MKAAVCRAFGDDLSIEDVTLAPPRAGEVRVRLAACAICHSDLVYMDGGWGGELPAVFGHEAAGIVAETGPGVERPRVGDAVVVTLIRYCGHCAACARGAPVRCEAVFPLDAQSPLRVTASGETLMQGLRTGAFAEEVVVDASQAIVVPPDLPLDRACLLACGVLTGAGSVLNTAGVRPGESVAVIGAGGVGLNAIQGAALAGAFPIVALDPLPAKRAAAARFNATHALDPAAPGLAEALRAINAGRLMDWAFVTVGSPAAMRQATEIVGRGGGVVIVGMPPTGVMAQYDPGSLAAYEQRLLGSKMGSARPRIDIPYLAGLYQEGRLLLDELVTGRFPLSRINEAVAASRSGTALRSVIVFDA